MSSSETRTTSSTSVADHRQRQRAGRLDADAVGDRRLAAFAAGRRASRSRPPGSARSGRRRCAMSGRMRPGRGRHAGDQAAAADRDDERVDRRLLRQHLERDRALAGDHGAVVVGMDDGRGRARRRAPGRRRARRRRCRRAARPRRRSCACSRPSPPRRSAASRSSPRCPSAAAWYATAWAWLPAETASTPAGALGGGQLRHLVERAALLERRGELQVLELEEHLATADRRQRARRQARRLADLAAQPRGGGADVVDRGRGGRDVHHAIVSRRLARIRMLRPRTASRSGAKFRNSSRLLGMTRRARSGNRQRARKTHVDAVVPAAMRG